MNNVQSKFLIHELFEMQVLKTPENPCVRFEDQVLSYSSINDKANMLAHFLREKGITEGDTVGVCLKRSHDLIITVLAVLKCGANYLPLDPDYPEERLSFMLTDSSASIIIFHNEFRDRLPRTLSFLEINLTDFNYAGLAENLTIDRSKVNLGYIIYTSGSTGNPKGVCLGHSALVNLIQWQITNSNPTASQKTLQFTPLSFDVHFQEIFSTLCSGHELVLISEQMRLDSLALLKTIESERIGRIFLPFVALNHLCEVAIQYNIVPSSLLEVITAGEQLKITKTIRSFFNQLKPSRTLNNHYGPSESHVVTSYQLSEDSSKWESLPSIGKPIVNTVVHLLDAQMKPVGQGLEGEMYLSGVCLAEGYINNKEQTDLVFINHPVYGRIYKTGDKASLDKSGNYNYLGRGDGQVKIRGYRIELSEIEVAIDNISSIDRVCVKVFEDDSSKYLAVFYTGKISGQQIRSELIGVLPEYMIPSYFYQKESITLTPSGKINRKLLKEPKRTRPDLDNDYIAADTDTEKTLVSVFEKHLKIEGIGLLDNFFDLGGNSLMALKILAELKRESSLSVPIVKLFQDPTIKSLVAYLNDDKSSHKYKEEYEKRKRLKQSNNKDIAIIAMNGKFPGANNVDELWNNIISKKNSVEKFDKGLLDASIDTSLSDDPNYVLAKGIYPGYDTFDTQFFGITPNEAKVMDPQQRKFLELSYEALELSGYTSSKYEGSIGVFAGMANNSYASVVNEHKELIDKVGPFNVMLANEKDYIATRVAHKLDLTGPALSIHTGCSTSLVSIIQAVKSLREGDCDLALAGGIAISGTPYSGYLFQPGGILSVDGICRPFDAKATGTIFNDGGGVLVLKRLEDAITDKDKVISVIKGVGLNNDGAAKASFTAPSVDGQVDVILRAQADAGITAETIGYIETHGTATPVGDPIEFESLSQAFRVNTDKKNFSYIGSIKANIGHLTSAAGVAGVIKASKAVQEGVIPAMTNFEQLNSAISEDGSPFIFPKVQTKFPKLASKNRAAISSFGVGGTNAHIIIESFDNPIIDSTCNEAKASLIKLSAKTEDGLEVLSQNIAKYINSSPNEQISYTLDVGRADYKYKRFIIADSNFNKISSLNSKQSSLGSKGETLFMFPGQGAQYIKMGQSLASQYPIFKDNFDRCAQILLPLLGEDIRLITDEENLSNTFYTQPSIFAFEYSLAMLYLSTGITPSGYIGHSVGEFVAAALSGVFSLSDGLSMIAKRAQLMSDLPSGSMLSVSLSRSESRRILEEYDFSESIQIAASNARELCVLAGPDVSISSLIEKLNLLNIRNKKLHTSHAFHSNMMNPIVEIYEKFVDAIPLSEPTTKMYSTVTGRVESKLFTQSSYWAKHMRAAVLFNETISPIVKENRNVLLEIGPRNTLATLATKEAVALKIKDFGIISSNKGAVESEDYSFKFSLGQLWLRGIQFNLSSLITDDNHRRLMLPTYPFVNKTIWLSHLEEKKVNNKVILNKEKTMTHEKNEKLQQRICEIFEDASGIDISEFSSDSSFLEMGMDSLFLTQVALSLKKELKIEITFRQLMEEFSSTDLIVEGFVDLIDNSILGINENSAPKNLLTENVSSPEVPMSSAPSIQLNQAMNMRAEASSVEALLNKQLELMGQQLQILSGVGVSSQAQQAQNSSEPVSAAHAPQVKSKQDSFKRGTDVNNSKKAFGACARINTKKEAELSTAQIDYFKSFTEDYNKKTVSSKRFAQDNRINHADPRSVTGFRPEMKELTYPIVVAKSESQTLTDLDGNEYIDMTCGFGSNFFGNGNSRIKKYVLAQLEQGIEIGPQHALTADVSKLACELTGFERAAFCNTGSEAVLGAMRVARTVTGRDKIIVFEGSYHGISDEVIIRGSKSGKSFPGSPGITSDAVQNMIVLEYGTDESLEKVRELCSECAAVLVEPVQSRRSDFHPGDFLRELRQITSENETCLIFDEVITGFRIHPGGAQAYFGVKADLGTYGKIIGGGMPIGMLAGRGAYMDALDGGFWEYGDDSTPTVGVTYFAGTFVRHPLALAAAKGALEIIKEGGEELLNNVTNKADNFCQRLNVFLEQSGVPLKMDNFGSLMKPKWSQEVKNGDLLFTMLRYNGVHVYDGFPWFVNLAHTDAELEEVIQRVKRSVATLQFNGFLPGSQELVGNSDIYLQDNPPTAGAKLGTDEQGNPAWFIEKDGEILQVD